MDAFSQTQYLAKKKFFKLFGGEIKIFDAAGTNLLFFVKQKAFKLKEDITIFADEGQNQPLLKIQARSVIDFGATYDVSDAKSGQKLGALRRKGLKSILRDEWEILSASDSVVGSIIEDSMMLALVRRFLTNLVPQSFSVKVGDSDVGMLKQTFNPFVPQFRVDFSMDTSNKLDRKMGIASVIMLQIVEGRQQS